MRADDIRFLYAYDRWATQRVLDALDDIGPAIWGQSGVVGERGLGSILVHQLGAEQRWRNAFQGSAERPRLEDEPLPSVTDLRRKWDEEWMILDAWLPTVTDALLEHVEEGVPVWQMMVHVMNHGTQHRSEAAALLTAEGRSPGELDLIDYAEKGRD